jgi:hypothetical protein
MPANPPLRSKEIRKVFPSSVSFPALTLMLQESELYEPGQAGRKGFEANLLADQHRHAILQPDVT